MGDAYECDCCGAFNDGRGGYMHIAEASPSRAAANNYDWLYEFELCADCRGDLEAHITKFVDGGESDG